MTWFSVKYHENAWYAEKQKKKKKNDKNTHKPTSQPTIYIYIYRFNKFPDFFVLYLNY